MKLSLDASQSFHNLVLFSVGMYFRVKVTHVPERRGLLFVAIGNGLSKV